MCFSLKGWMKCRNWRTEEPEDPEGPENPEEPESPESPESPEASGKGPSGPLRKIRNLRKSQAQAAPHANICFLPQNHRLCADLFALPPRIYARNAARPCAADRKNAPASRRKSVSLRFPPEQAEGRSGTSGTSGKTGSYGNSGPPLRTHHTDYLQSHILQFKTQHTYFNYKQ